MKTNADLYAITKKKRAKGIDYQMVNRWRRQAQEQWEVTRSRVFQRDQGTCQSPPDASPKMNGLCQGAVDLKRCHIDHIRPLSSGGSNHHTNLRTLCPVCHALRIDPKHISLSNSAVKKGLVPANWKDYVWE